MAEITICFYFDAFVLKNTLPSDGTEELTGVLSPSQGHGEWRQIEWKMCMFRDARFRKQKYGILGWVCISNEQ